MTNLELALTNLSEATIVEIHKKNSSSTIDELKRDINIVGEVIKSTKKDIENKLGKEIISNENHINLTIHDK